MDKDFNELKAKVVVEKIYQHDSRCLMKERINKFLDKICFSGIMFMIFIFLVGDSKYVTSPQIKNLFWLALIISGVITFIFGLLQGINKKTFPASAESLIHFFAVSEKDAVFKNQFLNLFLSKKFLSKKDEITLRMLANLRKYQAAELEEEEKKQRELQKLVQNVIDKPQKPQEHDQLL